MSDWQPLVPRDRDGLYYDTEYPVLSNFRAYPTGYWQELDDLRAILNKRTANPDEVGSKDVYYAIIRWRRSERYKEAMNAGPIMAKLPRM